MKSGSSPTFRRNVRPTSTVSNSKPKQHHEILIHLLLVSCRFLFGLFLDSVDGGGTFLRNVGELLPGYTESHPRSHLCDNLHLRFVISEFFFELLFCLFA
jgi:hypothetical protein